MTATLPAASPEVGGGRKFLHALGTAALFGLLGPLIGGLVTITGLGLWMSFPAVGDALMIILAMMIYGLWIAYPMGFVPAALVGAVIGYMDAFRGGTSFGFAVAIGVASGLGWSFMLDGGAGGEAQPVRIFVGIACVTATILCWKVTRWRVGR